MARTVHPTQDADIDIGRLFGALWRDRVRILVGSIVLTAIVFLVLWSMTPQYRSDARLLIESSESVFTRPQGDNQRQDSDSALLDPEGVTSQVEILQSSDLLTRVAEDLKLDQIPEFNPAISMSGLKAGLIALGLIGDPSLVPSEKRMLDAIRKRLDVYAVPKSRVIVIEFRSSDKDLAASFPNALAEAYLTLQSRSQLDTTGRAADYLADEITDLKESVREAEAAVADFRASSDLQIGSNTSVLATQQLGELSTELSRVRAERSSAEARARTIRTALENGAAIDSLSDIVRSDMISRLREREITLRAQLAEQSATLLSGHPAIQRLRSQVADLTSQIRAESRKVLAAVQNEAAIARDRERELTAELNTLKAASANADERAVELRALEREATSQRALLESYLTRFREAQSRDEGQYAPAKARQIARAVVPSDPAFPKMIPMVGAAFFLSLLIMMIATLMRELFSGRAFAPVAMPVEVIVAREEEMETEEPVSPREEYEREIAIEEPRRPVAAQAVDLDPAPVVPAPPDEEPAPEDDYSVDALVAHLIASRADRAIVVSPEGDPAAAASVALARALADEGLRTVLVDLTGTGAASRRMLADPECPGITDLLAASSSYSDVIYADYATSAHVIPNGTANPERAMRAADRLPIILDALVSAYDIVVVECGPTDAVGLKRLVGPGSKVVLSVADPAVPEIVEAAESLVAAGYEDLILVSVDGSAGIPPEPRSHENYAR